ncbi:serine hydrolase [Mycolicibacterium frederiksbergense]|uniref:serine hydrolase n=1 Tax=Mycolicibacterium frederiksbergense TaxID=117567 RepID=UPI00399AF0D9
MRGLASSTQRRALGVGALATAVVLLTSGCGQTGPPVADAAYGMHIDTNTPQGLRAKQLLDMVNSDWPIGTVTVGTLAVPDMIEPVGAAMDRLWADRPITVTAISLGAGQATLHVRNSYSVGQTITMRTGDTGLVDRFEVDIDKPDIEQWPDIDTEIAESGADYAYQVSKVSGGECTRVAGTDVDRSMPLASIFKLYVLLAVAEAVNDGTMTWNEPLTITAANKAVGSAGFNDLEPGARVSVKDAAQQMISASDNMATDMLMARLGPGAVERALVTAGHHDPSSMTPFPSTYELFAIGWGKPDVREEWKTASPAHRAEMLAHTRAVPYEPDPMLNRTPASPYGIEWYGTPMDICRVHAALQVAAHGPAAPVRDILSATPGIELDGSKWRYVGAKGGNLPGDLTFSWYAEDHTGQGWVVSYQLNWPKYRSLTAATWLLSIATQSFGLIPVT